MLRRDVDFNEDPFNLGTYDQVAHRTKAKAARSFGIGTSVATDQAFAEKHLVAPVILCSGRFRRHEARPHLTEWTLSCDPYHLEIAYSPHGETTVSATTPSCPSYTYPSDEIPPPIYSPFDLLSLLMLSSATADLRSLRSEAQDDYDDERRPQQENLNGIEGADLDTTRPSTEELRTLQQIVLHLIRSIGLQPHAFTPIRTQPRRTYDPFRDITKPDGGHVPMLLAQTKATKKGAWKELHSSLNKFGKASGLFRNVDVRQLGKKPSGPFQIRISPELSAFNLVDVGYGVSQVLPILVDCLQQPINSTFLIQQPEVHLHPKAQAELASTLAALAMSQSKKILIETHSDHILDRIRLDIRDRDYLSKEDVCLLFFERKKEGTEVYEIEIDDQGNLTNAPPNYRSFFLREDHRMLFGLP